MPAEAMISLSLWLRKYIEYVGRFGSVFIWPLVFVTMWDVIVRKLGGMQYWLIQNVGSVFESTKIQEWEWHFHTVLFALVLGYGYVNNRHVRVDLIREKLSFRKQAWIEFFGCTFFMIPYCVIVSYFALESAYESFVVGEISASLVGLSHRWIIKSVLVIGLLVAAFSGFAVWLQAVLVLFTPSSAVLNSTLNQESSEEFAPKDLLKDAAGSLTGTPNSIYVDLQKFPLSLKEISVTDESGPVKFKWAPDTSIVYFAKAPTKTIAVRYSHRFQLMTLRWPEELKQRGGRTRSI
jgi:TRAP-type mannitol/chloroaromatic compound transport system permease small subunit